MRSTTKLAIDLSIRFSNPVDFDVEHLNMEIKKGLIEYLKEYRGENSFLNDIKAKLPFFTIPSDKQLRWVAINMIKNFNKSLKDNGKYIQFTPEGEYTLRDVEQDFPSTGVAVLPEAGVTMQTAFNVVEAAQEIVRGVPETAVQGKASSVARWLLQAGIYTVEGMGEHRTFKVSPVVSDREDEERALWINLLVGPNNEGDYRGVAHVTKKGDSKVWYKKVREMEYDVNTSKLEVWIKMLMQGEGVLKAAHCNICNRLLTVPVSLFNGVGPRCAEKAGF